MNQQDILNDIKNSSGLDLSELSLQDLDLMLKATVEAIDSVLDKQDRVNVEPFGVFSRRKNANTSMSFFTLSDALNENINK